MWPLNGTTAGSNYDQLNVTGSSSIISLGGANLNVTLAPGFTPATGTVLTIINNWRQQRYYRRPSAGFLREHWSPSAVIRSKKNKGGSGKSVVLTAGIAAVTTTLTSLAHPSAFGQSVTFTATVAGTSASQFRQPVP